MKRIINWILAKFKKLQGGTKYLPTTYLTKEEYVGYIICLNLDSKKANHPIRTWTRDMKRHFTQGNIPVPHKHMKRCSVSFTITEMQTKLKGILHYKPIGMS